MANTKNITFDQLQSAMTKVKSALDGKAASSHGTHVSYGTSATAVGASASAGSASTVSRSDHVHSLSKSAVTTALGYTPPTSDTNTTYTFATGDSNGQIKITPSSGTASNVSVKGLNSAAYLAASETDSASTVVKRNTDGRIKISDMPTGQKEADYIAVGSTRTNGALGMITASEFKSYLGIPSSYAPTNAQKNSNITKAEIEAKLTGAITTHTHSYLPLSGGTVNGDLTVTGNITGAKVYGAVYNDYAEWFEREDVNEVIEAGDIVSWSENGVTKSTEYEDSLVVGVYSDSYGHILGGEELADMEENIKKYVPIGLCGRVYVKVTGEVKRGDLITASDIPGVGIKSVNRIPGTIIGKALESYDGKDGIKKIKIMVFNN